jgi:hypothetical protein
MGVFHDTIQPGTINNSFVDATPFSPQISLTQPKGSFSSPYVGIVNPYPSPFPPPRDSAFPEPVPAFTFDPANGAKALTPVNYSWNLMLERQLPGRWVIRAGYVASHASRLMETIELNPAVYFPGSKLSTDQRRALQPYGSISEVAQDINSSFNSMQLTLQKRYSGRLSVLANYTWSKSMDDMPFNHGLAGPGNWNSPIPWNAPGRHEYDRGPSEFDHTHRVVISYIYDLPKPAKSGRLLRAVASGWEFTGIVLAQSGVPITVLAGRDQSQTGIGADRANYLGGSAYGPGACASSVRCVDYLVPSAFGLPATGSLGTVGKGEFRGPNFVTWDIGIYKEFPLTGERCRLQLRAEFFNATNRVNLSNPNLAQSAGGFGSITSAGDPRIGQLSLKLSF